MSNAALAQVYDLTPPPPKPVMEVSRFDESDIWNDFKEGSEEAFSYIYESYYSMLCKNALKFSTDMGLIEDCIQDLFITIHKNRKNLGNTNCIKAYLSLSAKRKLARYLKKESKYETISEWKEEDMEEDVPFEFTMVAEQEKAEEVEKLNTALAKLPVRQRQALQYFYYEECSYSELADLMKMSNIKSARNLVYKGLNSLKAHLN